MDVLKALPLLGWLSLTRVSALATPQHPPILSAWPSLGALLAPNSFLRNLLHLPILRSNSPLPRFSWAHVTALGFQIQHFAFHHNDLLKEAGGPITAPIVKRRKSRHTPVFTPNQSVIHA